MFGWELARRYTPAVIKRTLKASLLYRLIAKWRGPVAPSAEPDVYRVIRQVVRPGWVCVDVGANNGAISCLLAKLVGDRGLVVAFEPYPDNVTLLRENLRRSRFAARVKIESAAVSDGSCSHLALFPGKGHGSAEWNIVGHDIDGNRTGPELEVAATSLDAYFPPGSSLDFVKVDVEMAGAQVLDGMRRLLNSAHPIVLMEFHDEAEWDGRKELFAAGYDIYDMKGKRLDPMDDYPRVYHCLAIPQERDMSKRVFL